MHHPTLVPHRAMMAAGLGLLAASLVGCSSPAGGPTSEPAPTVTVTVTATETITATATATATVSAAPSAPAQSTAPATTSPMTIDVSTRIFGAGEEVGPGLYEMGSSDGEDNAGIAAEWQFFDESGVLIEGEHCQILASASGPSTVPAQRSTRCSNSGPREARFRILTPGDYTITIVDELSGIQGEAMFTVLPRS